MSEYNFKEKADRRKFYESSAWRKLRKQALQRDNFECVFCKNEGRVTTSDSTVLEVDHISEIEHHPELALDIDNLRTLC